MRRHPDFPHHDMFIGAKRGVEKQTGTLSERKWSRIANSYKTAQR